MSQEPLAFSQVAIPRDELRQQRLLDIKEFRCAFKFPLQANYGAMLIAETFRDGKHAGWYRMASDVARAERVELQGFISVAWLEEKRELVALIDDGSEYNPNGKRIKIPVEEFDSFMDSFCYTKSFSERRNVDRPASPDAEIYPVLGICGQRHTILVHPGRIKTSADFVEECSGAGAHTVIVVYLYFGKLNMWPRLK